MMREILFQGKRSDNGEWVEGYCCLFQGSSEIFVPFTEEEEKQNEGHIFSAIGGLWHKVIPKTVGQFTGLTDKNGKKIFEGDIVTIQNDAPFEMTGHIAFDGGCFELHDPSCDMYECLWYEAKDMEVFGNIHDNPELLEE